MGGKNMKDVGGAGFAGSSPSFLGRERAAVNVDVGPERRLHTFSMSLLSVSQMAGSEGGRRRPSLKVCSVTSGAAGVHS